MDDDEALTHLAKMNVVLLGIPGAGKTTLSEALVSLHLGIDYISLGDISRNLMPGSPEQLYLEQLFQGEAPTGDTGFFLGLIESRIDTAREQGHGFILDGIPKKASEVQPLLDFFEAKDLSIDAVISCEASPLETYNRIAARDSRPGSEDSMTVFLNRTKMYLADIDSFKDRLTADGAHLFTLDTEMLNQQRLVDIILANVGTIVCFRSGSPADERLVLPLFMPFIQQGEIANLPAYSYYARIAAVEAQEPMSGMTVVVNDKGSSDVASRVIQSSRERYAKKAPEDTPVEPVIKPIQKKTPKKKPGKNHLTKKAGDELSGLRSVR